MKIVYLSIYNSTEDYDKMLELQNNYISDNFYFISFKELPKPLEYIIENNIIYISGKESYVPGILQKTIAAMDIITNKLKIDYDFLIRTNVSTYINFHNINNFIKNFNSKDCIFMGEENSLQWTNIDYGVVDNNYFGTNYYQGVLIIFSKKLVQIILNNSLNLNYSIIDDVSLGLFVNNLENVIKINLDHKISYNNKFNCEYFAYANNQNKNNRLIDISNLESQILKFKNNKFKILYRISNNSYDKLKPDYLTKESTFNNFINIFKDHDIYVIADNVNEELYVFLKKFLNRITLIRTSLSNAGAFMFAVKYAIDNFKNEDIVYFAEDDYMYTSNAPAIIMEGLELGDYSSGYDHPDKYINKDEGGNPFISLNGEQTVLMRTKNSHWKFTNSTCMTFASRVKTIKEDYDIYYKYCNGTHPHDFAMFTELINNYNRRLVTPIPGVSTHGVVGYYSPFIEWENIFLEKMYTIVIPINPNGELKRIILFIKFLKKYLYLPEVYKIFVITSNNMIEKLKEFKFLTFINEEEIEPSSNYEEKWFYQQILKLKIARLIKTKYYLILDDDMFLIKELKFKDLFYNNRVIYFHEKYPHGAPVGYTNPFWWENSCKILNYNVENLYNKTDLMGVTPQTMITDIVLELLNVLPTKMNYFTEYSLYWIYIIQTNKQNLYTIEGPKLLDYTDEEYNIFDNKTDNESYKIVENTLNCQKYHFLLIQSFYVKTLGDKYYLLEKYLTN
jgi:hypothetical protein